MRYKLNKPSTPAGSGVPGYGGGGAGVYQQPLPGKEALFYSLKAAVRKQRQTHSFTTI